MPKVTLSIEKGPKSVALSSDSFDTLVTYDYKNNGGHPKIKIFTVTLQNDGGMQLPLFEISESMFQETLEKLAEYELSRMSAEQQEEFARTSLIHDLQLIAESATSDEDRLRACEAIAEVENKAPSSVFNQALAALGQNGSPPDRFKKALSAYIAKRYSGAPPDNPADKQLSAYFIMAVEVRYGAKDEAESLYGRLKNVDTALWTIDDFKNIIKDGSCTLRPVIVTNSADTVNEIIKECIVAYQGVDGAVAVASKRRISSFLA